MQAHPDNDSSTTPSPDPGIFSGTPTADEGTARASADAHAEGADREEAGSTRRRGILWLTGAAALGAVGTAASALNGGIGGGARGSAGAPGPSASAAGIASGPGALSSPASAQQVASSQAPSPRVVGTSEGDTGAMAPDPSADGINVAERTGGFADGADGTGSSSGDSQEDAAAATPAPPEVYSHAPQQASLTATTDLAPGVTLRTSPAWHLARRASDAATAEIAADIESMGVEAWLDAQLAPESIDDSRAEDIVSTYFPWSQMTTPELVGPTNGAVYKASPSVTNAILARLRFSNRVLAESIVEMLADHVYVPLRGKGESFITGFDIALRKHALGRYADFLHAALTDVALLEELDNVESTRDSPNENLGRELLELYTVGRDTYSEDDVKGSTRLLTGHGKDWETLSYVYRSEQHATGPVDVLDFHDENDDAARGPDLLKRYVEYLCAHPATAQRLATRIARRYIEDEPSQAVVDHIAQAYLDNDTRIAPAVRAALTHSDFQASVGRKWRRPIELVMTVARAAHPQSLTPRGRDDGDEPYNTGVYGWLVKDAGQDPRMYATVDGYPDTAEYWMSTSRMMNLWNATQNAVIGDEKESGRTDWVTVLDVEAGANAVETAARISWHLTGYAWPDSHLEAVASVLAGAPSAGSAEEWTVAGDGIDNDVMEAVRLCFASPYGFLR